MTNKLDLGLLFCYLFVSDMAGKHENIKERILQLLYEAGTTALSGVKLSKQLNISRVAVWKHITSLKESGVEIQSGPKGYLLSDPENLLMPFCFKKQFQERIFHYQQIETTMDEARKLAREGAPHLSAVIAEHQSLGRGRLNRQWFSSKGGLWFTLILKPTTPPPMSYIYNFAASLSLSHTMNKMLGIDISVKWPNDLLLNGKKLAGLLSEMETRGDMLQFINIGIGINVNNSPEKDEPKAISLKGALGKDISRKQILQNFLDDFESRTSTIDTAAIINEWKAHTSTIGTRVRVETLGDNFEGLAVDVDDTGALIIKNDSGESQKIIYGDCFHT